MPLVTITMNAGPHQPEARDEAAAQPSDGQRWARSSSTHPLLHHRRVREGCHHSVE